VLAVRNNPIDRKHLATLYDEFFQVHYTGATILSPKHVYSISVLCKVSGKLELKYYLWGDIHPRLPVSYSSHLILLEGRQLESCESKETEMKKRALLQNIESEY
jgi:hypothetical protein